MSASVASVPKAKPVPIDGGRFLIVGGASLVGSTSAELFLDLGAAEVVVFDNLSQGSLAALKHLEANPRLKVIPGDVMRLPQLIAAMRHVDGYCTSQPSCRSAWIAIPGRVSTSTFAARKT
jgi:UDP-glucose 4-epimerase